MFPVGMLGFCVGGGGQWGTLFFFFVLFFPSPIHTIPWSNRRVQIYSVADIRDILNDKRQRDTRRFKRASY